MQHASEVVDNVYLGVSNPCDGRGSVTCDMTNLETTAVNQFLTSTPQTLWHKTQVGT